MMIPKHCSIFSLPMPKNYCKCSLGCWHFSLSLSRVLKTSHREWHTEIVCLSDLRKVWGLFSLGIALFLRTKRHHHHLVLIDIPWPRQNGSLYPGESSQNKHLLGNYVLQIYNSCGFERTGFLYEGL